MSLLQDDVKQLIKELEHIDYLLEDHYTDEALDELQCQSGTIQTMMDKARSKP